MTLEEKLESIPEEVQTRLAVMQKIMASLTGPFGSAKEADEAFDNAFRQVESIGGTPEQFSAIMLGIEIGVRAERARK